MRKSKFTDEQIVRILRESDEKGVAETAKHHGISDQTIYVWKKKFRGLDVDDVKRLKGLEAENAKLKKLLAEKVLENEILREVNAKKW
jgi:putative transposase